MSDKSKEQPKHPSAPLEASGKYRHGPEPERFKISGYVNWEDAVAVALRKPRPKRGWPK